MPIILENVSFSYSKKTPLETPALREINLHIEKGEFIGILGEKRSRQIHSLKILNGLLKPETGSVRVDGLDPSSKAVKRKIGMVFQQAADQLFCRTVYEEIAFGLLNFGYSKKRRKKEYLKRLKLFLLRHRCFPGTHSA